MGWGRSSPSTAPNSDAFQKALALFGDPELLELKRRVFDGVASGDGSEA
jgi:hypothetical protein